MARKNPLDMGVYHADGSITYDDGDETPKRGRGRPRLYTRTDLEPVLRWYKANDTLFPFDAFHASLQNWLGTERTPSPRSVRRWLDELPPHALQP